MRTLNVIIENIWTNTINFLIALLAFCLSPFNLPRNMLSFWVLLFKIPLIAPSCLLDKVHISMSGFNTLQDAASASFCIFTSYHLPHLPFLSYMPVPGHTIPFMPPSFCTYYSCATIKPPFSKKLISPSESARTGPPLGSFPWLPWADINCCFFHAQLYHIHVLHGNCWIAFYLLHSNICMSRDHV